MLDSLIGEAQRYVSDYGYTAVFLGVFLESFGLSRAEADEVIDAVGTAP